MSWSNMGDFEKDSSLNLDVVLGYDTQFLCQTYYRRVFLF